MLDRIREFKQRGEFAALNGLIPYAGTLGLDCEIVDGAVRTRLAFRDSNIGNYQMGFLHGGTVAALLEHAAVFQLLYEMDIRSIPRIVNISVDYLRPRRGVDTFATATLVKQGQRIANLRVQAWQSDPDKPVAAAHAHFLLSNPKEEQQS